MRNPWMSIFAAVSLLAAALPVGAQATDATKATAVPAEPPPQGRAPARKLSTPSTKKLVNLNAATAAELKALPGGSDEEAARIIAGRPYNSKSFLVTNKIVSDGRYLAIKGLVVAGEPAKPAAPKK